jgi:long-chain acyl-CoA synthetase
LLAVIEPQIGMAIDVDAIRTQLRSALADYKVPRRIEVRAELPREDSGKIFKRHLRDPYWEKSSRRI